MSFSTYSQAYLTVFREDMKHHFHLTDNAEYRDRRFPLYAVYQHEDRATLISRNGKSVCSYEFCYFDTCEQLTDSILDSYFTVLEDMCARYVPWSERSHGYSMLSLVILTGSAPDRAMQKRIRKFKHEEKRRRPEDGYGWCSARLCVIDVTSGSVTVNAHGKELANRVKMTLKRL